MERFHASLIYLNSTELKTIQLGIRMFISQYAADYALIMAVSVCALDTVVIIFIACQKFFVEGVAASGIKAKKGEKIWHRHLKTLRNIRCSQEMIEQAVHQANCYCKR